MPNWEDIRKEWETSKVTLNALADKHKVKLGTLKSRKSREGWSRDPTKKDATKGEKVASVKKDATKQKTTIATPKDIELVVEEFGDENPDLSDVQRFFCLYY